MLKHLDQKVIAISSVALAIVALLVGSSISILLDVKHDAGLQIRDHSTGKLSR
jgi:hypothetical protein